MKRLTHDGRLRAEILTVAQRLETIAALLENPEPLDEARELCLSAADALLGREPDIDAEAKEIVREMVKEAAV